MSGTQKPHLLFHRAPHHPQCTYNVHTHSNIPLFPSGFPSSVKTTPSFSELPSTPSPSGHNLHSTSSRKPSSNYIILCGRTGSGAPARCSQGALCIYAMGFTILCCHIVAVHLYHSINDSFCEGGMPGTLSHERHSTDTC